VAKGRESGMPAAEQWESYFDPIGILESVGCRQLSGDIVEFGCGYGTFTIPAAQRTSGTLYALDIEPPMVAATALRTAQAHLRNVVVEQRDFVVDGSGRASQSMSFVLLFNILHIEESGALLQEAFRVLHPGGQLAIIHWNYDRCTPRGPSLAIRPRALQCKSWAEQAGFKWSHDVELPGSPWHWGMVLQKP
jgi:SAM-dependent methyltransferase